MEKIIKELNKNIRAYEKEADTDEKKEQLKGYKQAVEHLKLLAKYLT